MGISTHVLNTSTGRPAAGVAVTLARLEGEAAVTVVTAATDADGRVKSLLPPGVALTAGAWRLTFAVREYFAAAGAEAFYPRVSIDFTVARPEEHFHVPLLLSPFGYSTYRGS